jgi:superfamily II DNA or RNA helicase
MMDAKSARGGLGVERAAATVLPVRVVPEPAPLEDTEAYRVLLSRAHRKTGFIPAEVVARHILSVTRGADWPVKREALEALLRRFAFARADSLRIAERPEDGRLLGLYATRREGSAARPYLTRLESLDPVAGSCDCADFLRSSLSLCKHLLAILDGLWARPRVLDAVRSERPAGEASLVWDPVRPLTGPGDWLERVSWVGGAPPGALGRWLGPGRRGAWPVTDAHAGTPARRLALVETLLGGLGDARRHPALHALLRGERDRLRQRLRDAKGLERLRASLRGLKQKLYPYQREAVERFLAGGRLLLADDMGLGKTVQAIAACHALWYGGRVRRGLLLVPASLKPQWLREWQLFTDVPATIVEGSPDERRQAFHTCRRGFLVANYEQLVRDLETMHAWDPEIVVLDEAQRLKNWATKTALYVKQLRPPYRLVLTGTPMENRIEELASIVEWVDDFALEPKWRLVPWHTKAVDGRAEIGGVRHLDTLRTRLSPCMIRRIRREVLAQLPSRTDTRIPVEMTPDQMARHDELAQPIAQLLAIARKRPLTQAEFLKLMSLLTAQRIISNGLAQIDFEEVWPQIAPIDHPTEAILRGLSSPKLVELRELLGQVVGQQDRKVVVFSQWRRMLRLAHWAVRDVLADAGRRAVFFTGAEGQKRRTQNLVDLHDDPAVRVLFASDAGGVGLNLQRAASACVNIELPWNPAVLEQRIGRIYRLGQKRPIDVYTLVSEPGIESRIVDLVGNKRTFFTGLFDGASDEVPFERAGTFLSRIEKIVTPAKPPELPERAAVAEEPDVAEEREVDRVIEASDETRDPRGEPEPSPSTPADAVGRLFSSLQVRRTERGGLVIEAPPEVAATLAALFRGAAEMLQAVASPGKR